MSSASSQGGPRVRDHGDRASREAVERGISATRLLDFATSVNPYGPDPAVLRAIREAPVGRYPDPGAPAAREAIARSQGTRPDRVVLGNGATELLWTLARVLVPPGARALVVGPTFSEFPTAVAGVGGRVVEWRARASDGFRVDRRAVAALATRSRVTAVYVCNPNNPTGAGVGARDIARLARGIAPATLVLDESFLSLSDRAGDARAPMPRNVARVRSLTKDHAIPGVRVGYLVAEPSLAGRVEAARPTWTTSAQAQAAAVAAASRSPFVERSRRRLRLDRDKLREALLSLGLVPVPSEAPFLLVPVGDSSRLAAELLRRGLLVRACASFGLPGYLRFAVRPAEDARRLVQSIRRDLR